MVVSIQYYSFIELMRTFVWLLQFKFERVICCAFSSEFNNIIMYNIDFVLRLTLNLFHFSEQFESKREFTEVNLRNAFLRGKKIILIYISHWKKVEQRIDLRKIQQDVNYLEMTNSKFSQLPVNLMLFNELGELSKWKSKKKQIPTKYIRRNFQYHFLR